MSSTWIVVANSAVARIFLQEKNGELKEIETLIHPGSRLHGRDLTSDRPGRTFESSSISRHAIEPTTSPKEVEFAQFAKTVSEHLHSAQCEKKFDRLCIAASPHFLGLLRQSLTPSTTQKIYAEIDKDITQMGPGDIRKHLTA